MQIHDKRNAQIPKTRVSISIDHTLPAQVDAEAAQLGVSSSNIYERAVNMYFSSNGAVSTTIFEKKHIAKMLLLSNCGRLEAALVDTTDVPMLKFFRYFFTRCTHNADGGSNRNKEDIDKELEMSVFTLLESLKYVDIELYDQIMQEMKNYGRLRDRYNILVDL